MSTIFRISLLAALNIAALNQLNAQWVRQNSGTTGNLTDVVMLSNLTAVAVSKASAILRTTDAGKTWIDRTLIMSYRGNWNAVSFCDSSSGVVAGDNGVVFWTLNGGLGWLWGQLPALRNCRSALCTGPGSCCVGTDSGWVFSTSDTGHTWLSEKISDWPVRSIFPWRGTEIIIGAANYAITSRSFCKQYVVPPPSWSEDTLSEFEQPGSEAYDGEFSGGGGYAFVVGGRGDYYSNPVIIRKPRAGGAWTDVSPATGKSGVFLGVSAPSTSVIYVCGSSGMIYKTTDGGDSWGEQDVPTKLNINATYFFDEKHGLAVGDSGLILYTETGGLLGVDDQARYRPEKFALSQNYPNPFNPVTAIRYDVSANSYVTLKVYDVLGRVVGTLVDEARRPGRYEVKFDAVGLASGVYFCRLEVLPLKRQGIMFTMTRKLVILK